MVNFIFIIIISIYDLKSSIYNLNDDKYPPVHLITPSHGYIHVRTIFTQHVHKGQIVNDLIWNLWSIFVFVMVVIVSYSWFEKKDIRPFFVTQCTYTT